jgi:tetratricopeptide (TPR) repeat protein
LMAKLSALGGGESARTAGWDHIERARPLASTLGLADLDPLRGELDEACGMVARAGGEHERAIACHERAAELFAAIDRPTLIARAHNNVGANAMELGDGERAGEAYRRALTQLDDAGVPPSYPTRIELEFNLGLLALESEDHEGEQHFEFVIDHGTPDQRLEAMILAAQLLAVGEADVGERLDDATQWAEAALNELQGRAVEADPVLVLKLQAIAGPILAERGDPRGEVLLRRAVGGSEVLGPEFVLGVEQTWIELLERQARCDEAGERLDRVIEWSRAVGLEQEMMSWRGRRQASLCRRESDAG